MTISVIGSGFGRTGTMSLKLALEKLGFGPCHHMEEVIDHPDQLPLWASAARGESVSWDDVYVAYRSTVDWPGAHFWREIAAYYPEARVIHTVRPAERWWESFSGTIGAVLAQVEAEGSALRDGIQSPPDLAYRLVNGTFRYDDRDAALAAFEARTRDVVNTIGPDRLLVFDVAEGWEPLCNLLKVAVPEEPFPRSNDRDAFWELVARIQ